MKYKVVFEFKNNNGIWMPDDFTNNGKGFIYSEAVQVAKELAERANHRNIKIIEV